MKKLTILFVLFIAPSVFSQAQNVWNKNKEWLDNVVEYHSSSISAPIVAGNHFSTKMHFDITFKDRGRQQLEELAVFEVKDENSFRLGNSRLR